ncbi:hypothetical protein BV25DRAFT_1843783 [Artomyces pyxidatus]|uniref:Uncharacterized protein n=2 Tax=Artomyces pyxidatus TaxID=48021 RepID=A0ACB8SCU1_9AGAM|nr:hypothetical protein BV25DRAFT_1843810 [Artomyces pyxidatus]KAI0054275.1 hypothetical protein BV25DRAFT_1843783 [Artomyces pyxidatus]
MPTTHDSIVPTATSHDRPRLVTPRDPGHTVASYKPNSNLLATRTKPDQSLPTDPYVTHKLSGLAAVVKSNLRAYIGIRSRERAAPHCAQPPVRLSDTESQLLGTAANPKETTSRPKAGSSITSTPATDVP